MQHGVEIRRPPFNGPANHVREVVQSLGRRGHTIRVLAAIEGRIWRSDDLREFVPVDVPRYDRGPMRLLERGVRRLQSDLRLPYAAWFESRRFSEACVQELRGCQLLYERFGWMGYGSGLAARRLGVPLVLEDNGDHLFDLDAKGAAPQGMQRRLSLALMGRAVRRASHIVSSGAGWREQFIRRWGIPADRITTIENGTALIEMLRRDDLKSFNTPAPGAEPPVTLVYLGGFYAWHGVPVLLDALSTARARGAQASLLMIGSGDGLPEAKAQAARLGLNGAVTFAGHMGPAQYAPLLAAADVGLSPYCGWPEFSGLKVLDYKAAGLPTIASGLNGHPPTLEDGRTAVIVPPCQAGPLADAIERLCRDAELRRRMGQAARLDAEAHHAWEHTAERLEQLYEQVLAWTA
jgi:glycosyltransferase involved in cell wall biosynthesis